MIRLATEQDDILIRQKADDTIGIGPRLWVCWELFYQNPSLPYNFYIVDEKSILLHSGGNLTLLGAVPNEEEMNEFVKYIGCRRFISDGWLPEGWKPHPSLLMVWKGARRAINIPEHFIAAPNVRSVVDVVQNSEFLLNDSYEDALNDLLARKERGLCVLYGVNNDSGTLVSTSGAWCLTEKEAYISGVATLPAARGRGYAAAQIGLLCATLSPRRISLVCHPKHEIYYRRMNFSTPGAKVLMANNPAFATEEDNA